MNLPKRLFIAVALIALFSACSESPPSPSAAEQALRQEIEAGSQGHIKLVSFSKTDGQRFEVNGIPGYAMDFEAEIEFEQSGSWLTAGFGPYRLAFGFTTEQVSPGTMAGFLNQTIDGGKLVQRGTRVKITGSMTGAKKESGWKFESAKNQISGVVATSPVPPVRVSTPVFAPVADSPEVRAACINNLQLIDATKQMWALEERKQNTDTPAVSDLLPHFGSGQGPVMPRYPAGGTYSINSVQDRPTCSIPGHVLR